MIKRVALAVGSGVLGLALLFVLANRPLSEMLAYFRAGASTTVKSIEDELPDAVHDEKTDAEIQAARQQMVDRQVQLSLSQNQLKDLDDEIATLTQAMDNRKEVLASAYPVSHRALDGQQEDIVFVSTKFTLDEFQHEVDDLLAVQDRDGSALRIKQQGYARLAKSVAEGEAAIAEMKHRLLEIEQDFAVLKARRDQAHMEADTLDLVAGATADRSSAASEIGKSVKRLEGQVEKLEARNDARRSMDSVENRVSKSKLARSFNRLEALKKYAAESKPQVGSTEDAAAKSKEGEAETIAAKKVVIEIHRERDEPASEETESH